MADSTTIAEVLNLLTRTGYKRPDAWQGMKPTEVVDLWREILADVPNDAIKEAALGWTRGANTFFPMPGQLLAQIGQAQKPVTEGDRKAAGDAVWALIKRQYHSNSGMYGDPGLFLASLPEAARDAIESAGGWKALKAAMCATDEGFSLSELGRAVARQIAVRPDSSTPAGVAALIEASKPGRPALTVIAGGRS